MGFIYYLPNKDLPTKFHPNRTKIAKVGYLGWLGVGRVVGLNIPPAILQAHLLLLDINETSPPSFIQIGPKLTKFVIWGDFKVVEVDNHTPSHTIC